MRTKLALLSALEVVAFAGALVLYLQNISMRLARTGGYSWSYLAKVNYGVSAIEKETSALAPQVTQLNQGLTAVHQKLAAVDRDLKAVGQALGGKERSA